MSTIEWEDSFSVNNPEIDEQHKKWFAIYNDLHESFSKGDTDEYSAISAGALEKMQDYSRDHFGFEEAYMRKIGYPDIVAHRRAHRDFDTQIYEYNRDIREGRLVLNTMLIKIIRNWLLDHVLGEDKKYGQFIAGT